jgi:hypothetical protein
MVMFGKLVNIIILAGLGKLQSLEQTKVCLQGCGNWMKKGNLIRLP